MIGCKLQNIFLRFGSREIFRNLHLEIQPGEFVALVGASGSGKSTLLRLIGNLQKPSEGDISFTDSPRRAFVFQDANLLPWRNVEKNVALPSEIRGAVSRDKVLTAIKTVHMSGHEKLFPHQLSGGMKMRTSLARALSSEPNLLLLDEPFASLDEVTRFDLQEQLRELWRQKKWTTFFVTHSLSEALFLADRILILKNQQIQINKVNTLPFPRNPQLRQNPEFNRQVAELSQELRR